LIEKGDQDSEDNGRSQVSRPEARGGHPILHSSGDLVGPRDVDKPVAGFGGCH